MSETAQIEPAVRYGIYELCPVMFTFTEAWSFRHGKWWKEDAWDVLHGTRELSAPEFTKTFPGLPALPEGAFK